MAGFDFKQAPLHQRGLMIAGGAALLTSFLPYVGFGPFRANAWHGLALLGLLLLFATAGVTVAQAFGTFTLPKLPGGLELWLAGAAGLGTLLLIIVGFSAGGDGLGALVVVQWGGYLLFLAGIAETAFAAMGWHASRTGSRRPEHS